jgi:hypothetical protein
LELANRTPFPGQLIVVPDRDGYETLVSVLKGTFTVGSGACEPAEEQAAIVAADEPWGEPGASSTRYESDLAIFKPATDVVMIGHAHAPKKGTRQMDVSLRVGTLGLKARVSGDRHWGYFLTLPRMSAPKPFEKIPLVFERAFGGAQPTKDGKEIEFLDERNPVGTGYVRKGRRKFINGLAVPNIEDPRRPLKRLGQKPPPLGFGYLGRHWLARRQYLGTYDKAWEANRLPLLPEDFDERAFCGAPAALQALPHLVGGEPVRAIGVTPGKPLRFDLPTYRPAMDAYFEGKWVALEPLLDTVVIEPDVPRVCLTWRARLRIHTRVRGLRGVRIREAR